MFSQWLGEEDELYKFISAAYPQQQADLTDQQAELYNFIPDPFAEEQTALTDQQDELHSFISAPFQLKQTTLVQQNPLSGNVNVKPSLSHVLDHGSTSTMDAIPSKENIKKIIHRDVERQRREQMSSLYVNLRSLIPREYLQGKRSMTNHMNGAIKYIMYMKSKIDGLNSKRDELMNIPNSLEKNGAEEKTDDQNSENVKDEPIITVKTCKEAGRIEITANIGIYGHSSLSKVMKVLHSEGMLVRNCTSTRVHQRMLHIIQLEALGMRIIDVNELYKKLMATGNIK